MSPFTQTKGQEMKIVVIGGTGLIGAKLVEKLRRAGHEALAASPESGVDTYTGKGLESALEGAQVVVDVSNAPAWEDAAASTSSAPLPATSSLPKPRPECVTTSRFPSSAPTGCQTAATCVQNSRRRTR